MVTRLVSECEKNIHSYTIAFCLELNYSGWKVGVLGVDFGSWVYLQTIQ